MTWIPDTLISSSAGLRTTLRRLGVTRRLASLKPLLGMSGYETRVDDALMKAIHAGDCIWDVGANVGLYTERFATAVGPTGRVVAFEPIDTTCAVLRERVGNLPQVSVRGEALGAASATVALALDADPTSPTNTLTRPAEVGAARTQSVRVVVADTLLAEKDVPVPNVVKIDTEGFEEEVLWGMRDLLRSPALRNIMIEVHFALLDARGHRRAPQRLASLLQDAGFAVRWVDASHLFASRDPGA